MKEVLRKNQIKLYILALIIVMLILYIFIQRNVDNGLKINEIAFSQENGVDWVEIYNPSLNNLSLEGLYLTDKASNFEKFKIKNKVIVPSQGFVVIYGDDYDDDNYSVVSNFRISNGETVYLIAQDGATVIDSLTAVSEDDEFTDFSIGRFPDGANDVFIMTEVTKGEPNLK